MPINELKLILKHKYLNVTSEDEVLKAICLWTKAQLERIRQTATPVEDLDASDDEAIGEICTVYDINRVNSEISIQGLSEVLQNVNWDFVSL